MKRLYQILGMMLGGTVGIFIGNTLWRYLDHKTHPEMYAAQSAPWYLSIQIQSGFFLAAAAAILAAMWFVKRKMK